MFTKYKPEIEIRLTYQYTNFIKAYRAVKERHILNLSAGYDNATDTEFLRLYKELEYRIDSLEQCYDKIKRNYGRG